MPRLIPSLAIRCLLFASAVVLAEAKPWAPPPPAPDEADWIQLTSGEWLRGEIKVMENDQITFDSDKLKLRTFDLEDVSYIRTPRSFDIMRSDRSVVSGSLEVDDQTVKVAGTSFPREEMTAFSESGERELDHWSGELSAGIIMRSGNSKSSDINYKAGIMRRTARTRLEFDYTHNLSKTEGVESANNTKGSLLFDKFISDRAFIRVPSVDFLKDTFQNIDGRWTVGASYGYDIYRSKRVNWDATIGPAWQFSQFESVLPGEDLSKDAAAFVITTHLEGDITSDIDYTFDYRGQLTKKDVGETTHATELTLGIDLTSRLDLDLTFNWDRVGQPKADETGEVPEPDDFRLSLNLSVEL